MQKMEKLTTNQPLQDEKMRHELALLEAALYVAGRPLTLKELGSILKTRSKKKVKNLAKILMEEYAKRKSALEILELKDERYVLQLKADYTPRVRRLVNRPLLSSGPLKTLSYIAYRQPVSQKKVVEVRGHHAYGHIKLLKEMGLVAGERKGRSTVLRTTEYFADYFGLSHDTATMKRELKRVFEDFSKQEKPKQ
ncbi:SMC-Scp complex subunit ScpB [Candidatus Bathyarchaeota archaeon]|nr:MAG: SMC-Scp complex subunit ScpB [Candidatus Bathyarchaeota archaeon]RJS82259.1 MAG: SMC-Scp complex subunit ScpB [Candidatus Bathyarchaeota archaeon]